jgi:hypothetical protein
MSPVVLAVGAICVFLVLTCLLAPIRLQLILDDRRRSVVVSWLRVALGSNLKEKVFEFKFFDQTIVRKKFKKAAKDKTEKVRKRRLRAKEKTEEEEKRKSRFDLRYFWQERDLLRRVAKVALRFLWDILKAIRWNKLFLEVDLSTPDPALTGVLYGQLCAVKHSAEYLFPNARIRVQPDFVNQSPSGSAESVFSIRPVNLIAPTSRMFFALPKIRILTTFIFKRRR